VPNYFEVAEKGIELAKTCRLLPFEEVDAASVAAKVISELSPKGAKYLTAGSESAKSEQEIAEIIRSKLQNTRSVSPETEKASEAEPQKTSLSDEARARLATLMGLLLFF